MSDTRLVHRRLSGTATRLPLLTLAAVLAAGGCSAHERSPEPAHGTKSSTTHVATTGTVTGQVKYVGGPPEGAASVRPVAHGVVMFVGSGRKTAAMSEEGRFTADLEPGTYVVTATSPDYQSGSAPCEATHPVRVTAGHVTSVDVYCQVR